MPFVSLLSSRLCVIGIFYSQNTKGSNINIWKINDDSHWAKKDVFSKQMSFSMGLQLVNIYSPAILTKSSRLYEIHKMSNTHVSIRIATLTIKKKKKTELEQFFCWL